MNCLNSRVRDTLQRYPEIAPGIFTEDGLAQLESMGERPGKAWSLGYQAKVAKFFQELGKTLEDCAKEAVVPKISADQHLWVDNNVRFQWVPPSRAIRVDTTQVKNRFPPEQHPEMYKETERKGYVKTTFL